MPSREQWERIRQLFDRCSRSSAEEVERLLAAEADEDVVRGVRELLESVPDTRFLESPIDGSSSEQLSDYDIGEEIGRGGMGVIRAATHRATERRVAIKFLKVSPRLNAVLAALLRREAARTFALRHPNIVRIDVVGEEEAGPFIVMERVEGRDLGAILADLRAAPADARERDPAFAFGVPERSYPERVAHLLASVADALEYSRENGVVHRDVKPGNILIDRSGTPLVTDFGIAGDLDAEPVEERYAGSPHYMSPEQARRRSSRVDHRTDVYSLGIVGYELLTLRRPFDGPTDEAVFAAIDRSQPVPIRRRAPEVPAPLERVVAKAMRKAPELRYRTAGELADDLRRFLDGVEPLARPATLRERLAGLYGRRPRTVAAAGVAVLVLAAAGSAAWVAGRPDLPRLVAKAAQGDVAFSATRLALPHLLPEGDAVALAAGSGGTPLEEGWWWIVARAADGRYGEAFVHLGRGERPTLPTTGLTRTPDGDDMVRVPPGRVALPSGEEVAVAGFLMDRHEVTCSQYLEFLRATGEWDRRPTTWPEGIEEAWTDAVGELPVTSISFGDAEAYARWAGKRLPTCLEWEWAALGPERTDYVWGAVEDGPEGGANVASAPLPHPFLQHRKDSAPYEWAQYLEHCDPPGSHPGDRSWAGVVDLQGNVMEWTASPPFLDGVAVPGTLMRTVKGGGFRSTLGSLLASGPVPAEGRDHGTGFRCVKSIL